MNEGSASRIERREGPIPAGLSTSTTSAAECGRPPFDAAGVTTPARLYDLRATFASNALAAGVTPFELAKVLGTSVRMLERHYGTLIAGADDGIAARLDALDAQADRAREEGR